MGGGSSKKADALDAVIEDKLKLTMESLGQTKKEVLPLWKEFKKIDVDNSGQIEIAEIFGNKNIVMTEWGKRVFEAMDVDGSGKISFPEFYVGLWNYLAADLTCLQIMAFAMTDEDKGGKVSIDEVRQLIILIYGKGPNKKSQKELNKQVHKVMKVLDKDKSGCVTLVEWKANGSKIKDVFKPALQLQTQMRKAYLGGNFWTKASKHRLAVTHYEDLFDIHNKNYNRPAPKNSLKKQLSMKAEERVESMKSGEYDSSSDCEAEED